MCGYVQHLLYRNLMLLKAAVYVALQLKAQMMKEQTSALSISDKRDWIATVVTPYL